MQIDQLVSNLSAPNKVTASPAPQAASPAPHEAQLFADLVNSGQKADSSQPLELLMAASIDTQKRLGNLEVGVGLFSKGVSLGTSCITKVTNPT